LFNPTSRGQRFKKMFNPIKNCETLYKQLNFYFATNMTSMFLQWMIIMCHLDGQLILFQSKQMMTTLEEKYILPSLIELFTSLILGLMRLTYMELLSCMVALNFSNSFASFNANKVCRIAEFYPNDFSASDLIRLKI
jgi:hypothetical protein